MEHINLLGFLAPIFHYICKLLCVMNESLFTLIAYFECCRALYWCMFCILWRINILNHKYKQSRFGYHRTPHLVPISDMAWNTRTVFKARTMVANVNYIFIYRHGLTYILILEHLVNMDSTLNQIGSHGAKPTIPQPLTPPGMVVLITPSTPSDHQSSRHGSPPPPPPPSWHPLHTTKQSK